MKAVGRFFLLTIAGLALATSLHAQPWAWGNPVVPTTRPDPEFWYGRAIATDPDWILCGYASAQQGVYYVGAIQSPNSPNPSFQDQVVWSSTDLCIGPWCAFTGSMKHAVWFQDGSLPPKVWYKRTTRYRQGDWPGDAFQMSDEGLGVHVLGVGIGTHGQTVVHVAWTHHGDGYTYLEYRRSVNEGTSWDISQRLYPPSSVPPGYEFYYPSISTNGNNVYLCFGGGLADGSEPGRLWWTKSTDQGTSWSPFDSSEFTVVWMTYPSVTAAPFGYVYQTWRDNGEKHPVMMRFSSDYGVTWSAPYLVPSTLHEGYSYGASELLAWVTSPYLIRLAIVGRVWDQNLTCWTSTRTFAQIGSTFVPLDEHEHLSESNLSSVSAAADFFAPSGRRQIRTIHGSRGSQQQLEFQGAEWARDLQPIKSAQDGVNGPRTIARDPVSGAVHAVSELTPCGEPLIGYRCNPESPTCGWDLVDVGTRPAIGLDGTGNPWVTYVRADSTGSNETLYAAVRNADSLWTYAALYGALSGQHLGPPALAVFHSQGNWNGPYPCLGNVVFPVYSSLAGYPPSYIVHCRFDTVPGQVYTDVVDVGSYAAMDSCVSLCSGVQDTLHLAYQSGNAYWSGINCRMALYDTSTASAMSWSTPAMLTSTGFEARHPYIDQVQGRLYCAYRQQDMSSANQPISIARSLRFLWDPSGIWFPLPPSSRVDGNNKDWPVFSGENAVAWAESTGNWEILARVGMWPDTIVNLSNTSTTASKSPHILADSMVSYSPSNDMINVHCLWAEQANGDTYAIQYSPTPVTFSHAAPNSTRHNNGHKLLLGPGDTLHTVFTASAGAGGCGIVGYAKLASGCANWSRFFPMGGDMPSIGRDTSGTIWIVGRGPMATNIMAVAMTPGGGWMPQTIFACPPYQMESTEVGAPSLAGSEYGRYWSPSCPVCYFVFPVYNHLRDSSFIVMVRATPWSVQDLDTLDRAGIADDSFPSIGVLAGNYLHVTWQRGNRVCGKTGADTLMPGLPIDWSPSCSISDTDSLARHPTVEVCPDTVLVAWCEGTPGRIRVRSQLPSSAFDAWDSSITVSDSSANDCDCPTISIGDTVVIGYQRANGTGSDIFANVEFAENYQVPSNGPAEYCHVVYEQRVQGGDTQHIAHCVWAAEPSTGFYDVSYAAFALPTGGGGGGGMSGGLFDPAIRPMLFAPAPNPFNHTTGIRYQTNIAGRTSVVIHDVTGRKVCNLMTTYQRPGIYSVTWTGRDDRQRQLPEGIYFVRLQTPNYSESKKLILTQ